MLRYSRSSFYLPLQDTITDIIERIHGIKPTHYATHLAARVLSESQNRMSTLHHKLSYSGSQIEISAAEVYFSADALERKVDDEVVEITFNYCASAIFSPHQLPENASSSPVKPAPQLLRF